MHNTLVPAGYEIFSETQAPRRDETLSTATLRLRGRAPDGVRGPAQRPGRRVGRRRSQTIADIAAAQGDDFDNETLARAEEARQIIADCDQRLTRFRAALKAGTDRTLISRWTAEVNATRAAAEAQRRGPEDRPAA